MQQLIKILDGSNYSMNNFANFYKEFVPKFPVLISLISSEPGISSLLRFKVLLEIHKKKFA